MVALSQISRTLQMRRYHLYTLAIPQVFRGLHYLWFKNLPIALMNHLFLYICIPYGYRVEEATVVSLNVV